MTRFWTADLHFGHINNALWRGWAKYDERGEEIGDADAMNEFLIERWNEIVGPEDEVFVLGDAAMGNRPESLKIYNLLHGKKYLVPGNHDYCGPWHKKADFWTEVYGLYFEVLPVVSPIRIGGHDVIMSHFPYGELDHTTKPRFLEYRPTDEGKVLIHGHTHSTKKIQAQRQVHVGVDAWAYQPVCEEALIPMIDRSIWWRQ